MTVGVHNPIDLEILKGGDQLSDRVKAPCVNHQPIYPVSCCVVHSPAQDDSGETESTHFPNVFNRDQRNNRECSFSQESEIAESQVVILS